MSPPTSTCIVFHCGALVALALVALRLLPHGMLFALLLLAYPQSLANARIDGAPRREVHTVVIHTVSGPRCEDGRVQYSGAPGDAAQWKRFFDGHPFLGIHYIIDRQGKTAASTPEKLTANHALGHNEGTIGIELVHNGDGIESFSSAQIDALISLIRDIRTRHGIALEDIKSHAELDQRTFACGGRPIKSRQDPGENFPWVQLRHELTRKLIPELLKEPTIVRDRAKH